jgi:hypothetical protein
MLNERIGNGSSNNQPTVDSAMIDSFINELLHHRRQNSEDSGVGEGRSSINRTPDALTSVDCVDDALFLNHTDYATLPVHMEHQRADPHPAAVLDDSHLKVKSVKQHHHWLYQANI